LLVIARQALGSDPPKEASIEQLIDDYKRVILAGIIWSRLDGSATYEVDGHGANAAFELGLSNPLHSCLGIDFQIRFEFRPGPF
jgi:hypothetical protein